LQDLPLEDDNIPHELKQHHAVLQEAAR